MTETAGAKAEAKSPTIEIENNVAALSAALEAAREQAKVDFYTGQVARMQDKAARAEADLAAANEALARAQAELDAQEGAE